MTQEIEVIMVIIAFLLFAACCLLYCIGTSIFNGFKMIERRIPAPTVKGPDHE